MSYQLIALDLDGTLLSSDRTISPRNLAVLRKLAAQGVHICIATGRILETALAVIQSLDFSYTLAVYNGALVVDQPTGHVRFRRYLTPEQVRDILAFWDQHAVPGRRDIFTDDSWYMAPYTEDNLAEIRQYNVPVTPLPPLWPDYSAAKVMVTTHEHLSRSLLNRMRQELPAYSTALSTATLLEVMAGGVSKGETIIRMANDFGITLNEVVAFGDHINDVDMLQVAGFGVAMGNAVDDAKQVADHVTLRYDEDGVAVCLESLFSLAS